MVRREMARGGKICEQKQNSMARRLSELLELVLLTPPFRAHVRLSGRSSPTLGLSILLGPAELARVSKPALEGTYLQERETETETERGGKPVHVLALVHLPAVLGSTQPVSSMATMASAAYQPP